MTQPDEDKLDVELVSCGAEGKALVVIRRGQPINVYKPELHDRNGSLRTVKAAAKLKDLALKAVRFR